MSEDARILAVHRILTDPHLYVMCNACGSIVIPKNREKINGTCPLCDSYSFTNDVERIKQQAKTLLMHGERAVQKKDLE